MHELNRDHVAAPAASLFADLPLELVVSERRPAFLTMLERADLAKNRLDRLHEMADTPLVRRIAATNMHEAAVDREDASGHIRRLLG